MADFKRKQSFLLWTKTKLLNMLIIKTLNNGEYNIKLLKNGFDTWDGVILGLNENNGLFL